MTVQTAWRRTRIASNSSQAEAVMIAWERHRTMTSATVSSRQQQPHASAALLAHTADPPAADRSRAAQRCAFPLHTLPLLSFFAPAPLITLTPLPSPRARIFPLSSARLYVVPRLREAYVHFPVRFSRGLCFLRAPPGVEPAASVTLPARSPLSTLTQSG